MCGICGYSTKGKLSPTKFRIRANIAKALLIANESRGIDSTGVFLQNGKAHILSKDTCHATKFVREPEVIKLFEKDSHLMLGHTRQATTGTINKQNAHPFIKGNIVGIHNGMLSNYLTIASDNEFKIQVDSEVIFELLNKNNNDFEKTFKKIRGSASLAWINKLEPNTLYLVAHENPLSIAEVPYLNTIFFSSEFSALDSVLQAALGVDNYRLWEVEEDIVFKIAPDHKIEQTKVEFNSFKTYSNWGKKEEETKEIKETEDEEAIFEEIYKEFGGEEGEETEEAPKESKVKTLNPPTISSVELEYIKELGKKTGCVVCAKPLAAYAYVDEFQLELMYCLECIADSELEHYLWLNLQSGAYYAIKNS